MKILALETSTETASVALLCGDRLLERNVAGRPGHSETILPEIRSLLLDAGVSLDALDAIAFGAGPGAFTGLRLACGVAQGLAMGLGKPVIPVGTLAALASQCSHDAIFVAADARMSEVYFAAYRRVDGVLEECLAPACAAPGAVALPPEGDWFGFGSAFRAYGDALLPALLSGQGASITHSLLYAFFITLAYPLGCLFCTRFVHRFENKWQIVLSALMTVVFGTLFALQNNPVMLVVCGFMITWSNAWLTISYHAYQAEVFPTHIRARAVGFCYSFSRLSTAVTSILIGIILQYAGTPGVISFIVVSMLMVMLSVGIFAFVLSMVILGYLISTLARTQMQAMQLTFFFFLPSLMLSGFMFPFRGMPGWAQVLGECFPLTHFLRLIRGIMLKGATYADVAQPIAALMLFVLIFAGLALTRFRRTLD